MRNDLIMGDVASPLGDLIMVTDAEGVLLACDYGDHMDRLHRLLVRRLGDYHLTPGAVPSTVKMAVEAYFAGDLAAIDAVPVRLNGTPFQNKAWAALRQIPPGSPASYGEQAARVGNTKAARAVGSANHNNPYNLIVPCHRVLGSTGALTGYAGELERKRWLLDHEGKYASLTSRLI